MRVEMNEHYRSLAQALARISAAPTAAGVWTTLKELGANFGYTYLMAAEVPPSGKAPLDAIVYSDWRRQVIAGMASSPDRIQHPLICFAASSHAPFTVSELRALEVLRDTDWTLYLPSNILEGDGLIVPVHRGSELMGGMVFGGEKPDAAPLVRSILQVASHAAVDRVDALKNQVAPPVAPALSAREIQCLTYIAAGHEDEEISRILGISPRTVRFHVDSAKAKLGVSSRVQAVTKALRARMITV
jgi:DNA-binding CsgD family transcriptional regulator